MNIYCTMKDCFVIVFTQTTDANLFSKQCCIIPKQDHLTLQIVSNTAGTLLGFNHSWNEGRGEHCHCLNLQFELPPF